MAWYLHCWSQEQNCHSPWITVPYESNVIPALDRKTQRYAPLVADIESSGFGCSLHTVELELGEFIPAGTMKLMKTITGASKSGVKLFLTDISRTVVQCIHLIFLRRNNLSAPKFIISWSLLSLCACLCRSWRLLYADDKSCLTHPM